MESEQTGASDGRRTPVPGRSGEGRELEATHATWVRQAERVAIGEPQEVVLPLDVRAPGAAGMAVVACLRSRVAPSVLSSVQLLVSELVTNSVRHGGAPAGEQLA